MNVTPGFYAHLITLLSGLARGQIAVCLEGGYFLPTLSEAASLTLKALLGGPCPILDPIRAVHPTVVETICNVRRTLYKKWKCFKICEVIPPDELTGNPDEHRYKICYFGDTEKPPYPTRRCYPENSVPEHNYYARINKALRESTALLCVRTTFLKPSCRIQRVSKSSRLLRLRRPDAAAYPSSRRRRASRKTRTSHHHHEII
jgi:histone deacetylase 6